jgi:chemotaxis signal transduction protein
MKTMVCFRTAQGRFALPVESTLSVAGIAGLVLLPAPRADVVGLLPGEPPISVLATFGTGGEHVVIIVSDGLKFGLQVLEVVGVQHFDDNQIGPPPAGQDGGLVSGVVGGSGLLVLVVDAKALAARL